MKLKYAKSIKSAFKTTVPVMAGYLFLGITFGLVSKTSGFEWWVPVLMSVLIYSGALEFAAVPVLSAAFDPIGAFLLGITLSARHLFYGIPMLRKYENIGKMKPFLIFGLTDETFSILSATEIPDRETQKPFYFFVTLFNFAYWNLGTIAGTMLGTAVKIDLSGLDFALTALFTVLFIEQIRSKTGLKSGIVGLASAVLALLIFEKSFFVIASMLIIITVLIAGKGVIDGE